VPCTLDEAILDVQVPRLVFQKSRLVLQDFLTKWANTRLRYLAAELPNLSVTWGDCQCCMERIKRSLVVRGIELLPPGVCMSCYSDLSCFQVLIGDMRVWVGFYPGISSPWQIACLCLLMTLVDKLITF